MTWNSFKIFIILSLFVACSSLEVKVESLPDKATVYLQDGKKLKKLGVTPMQIKADVLEGADNVNLVLKKPGYQTHNFLIEKRTLSAKANIYAHLEESGSKRSVASEAGSDKETQKMGRSIATIQSQLLQNNFQQAETMAQELLNDYPYFAVGWNLLGNAYFLQNRHRDALAAYSKALEYEPDNLETQRMIQSIQTVPPRGGR